MNYNRTAQDNAGLAGTSHGARPCKGNHEGRDCTGWVIPDPRFYRITIEPLTGPAGTPTGRKACEAEGGCVSDALRILGLRPGRHERGRPPAPAGGLRAIVSTGGHGRGNPPCVAAGAQAWKQKRERES